MSRFLKSRQTMWARAVILFIGVLFHYQQALAVDTYMAEFMIESNATLYVSGALSAIKQTATPNTTMTIVLLELTAECKIAGNASTCNCSSTYIWSNDVCDNFQCCHDSYCNANISHYPALCIPKVKVRFNGTVQVRITINQTDTIKKQLTDGFKQLHGFECLNVSGPRDDGQMFDFKVDLSVIFLTDTLAKIIADLEPTVGKIAVETSGLVSIQCPMDTVKFSSTPTLNCRFEEKTNGSWNWNLLKGNKTFDLNTGSSITVSLPNETPQNCTTVQIIKLSGNWAGIYKCGFSKGSIVHAATAELKVALLPDKITMMIDPLTVECQDAVPPVTVTATIDNSTEQYKVTWLYQNYLQTPNLQTQPVPPTGIAYSTVISINCRPSSSPHVVIVSFTNQMDEIKKASITIPVIYAHDKNQACPEDSNVWPKTPRGVTVTIRKCEVNRVGYKERTCKGPEWMEVLDNCVNEELNKVVNAAANFKEGLGATVQVAIQIFSDLRKSMVADSVADLSASIDVLDTMSIASKTITLDNTILDTFLDAASNMLNNTWKAVNKTLEYDMSSKYLTSIEGLVDNIKMNSSEGNDTPNIQLKLCNVQNGTSCNYIVFGVEVNLTLSSGIVKTVGVKNLADKLNNSKFSDYKFPSIVVSATLQNSNDSKIDIKLDFPMNQSMTQDSNILCVFWNTTLNEWSEEGCKWKKGDNNRSYCECTHLTSFSVLMSKIPVTLLFLDEITYVGLGVSICSLIIFLIIEALVWSAVVKSNLSHFRHTALVNISLCLLLADCSFLAACFSSIKTSTWCLVLTVTKQYFFLAMFCWMLCLSIMLLHQLIFIFHPLRKRVYLLLSIILGYICPTVIVSATYVYYKYTGKPYHNTETCWLTYEGLLKGSIHAFLLPVGTIILMNLFSMGVVIMTLLKSTVSDGSKTDEKEAAKSIMKVMVFLTPVFGVTWVLGFFVLLIDINTPMGVLMNYAFTIINSFQGLFILLTGCFAEKRVKDEVLKLFLAGASTTKGTSESMKDLTKSTSNN
ncbi:adhesion G-protein coupled receptor F3-like [Oncorhynchus masou masou]|uniref:adhesion G-protein coupled receptor F3-like n=1 Tax=Oncorhynchus masou masou TaxID=90313 RepID=UPI0031837650